MAALVLKMSVSLDGYVAANDGSTDWITAGGSDDTLARTAETVSNAGAHLLIHPAVLGAGEWLCLAPPTLEPLSAAVFGAGAVVQVFAAHPDRA